MNFLTSKLDQLEAHLQALIEGRFAGLLPTQEFRDEFIHRLVAAMQAGTQVQPGGSSLAPDIYILLAHPDLVFMVGTGDELLQDLERAIQKVGEQSGLVFIQPPTVHLSPNSDLDRKSVEVIARISSECSGKTVEATAHFVETSSNIPPNAFLIVNGVTVFPLDQPLVNIGRRADNDLVIDDPRISRAHAQLRAIRGRYVLSDLGSMGGTLVNGQRVTQQTLHSRDVISLAGVPLVYGQDDVGMGRTQEIGSLDSEAAARDHLP